MIETQANVQQPPKRLRGRRTKKYPYETMEIGEMFFVPLGKVNSITSYSATQGGRMRRKFSTRQCWMRESMEGWVASSEGIAGAVPGVGVWRVE